MNLSIRRRFSLGVSLAIASLLVAAPNTASAQAPAPAAPVKEPVKVRKHALALHVDSFDFMAKGFSVWGNYYYRKNRFFVVGGKNELPDYLNAQSSSFREVRDWFVQGGYLRYLEGNRGFFLGLETIVQSFTITAKESGEQKNRLMGRIGPVVGYEWMPFDFGGHGFVLVPWMSMRFPIAGKWLDFDTVGEDYRVTEANFVMGLNVGYRVGF